MGPFLLVSSLFFDGKHEILLTKEGNKRATRIKIGGRKKRGRTKEKNPIGEVINSKKKKKRKVILPLM